jgi:GT2 family glycosyltransferase
MAPRPESTISVVIAAYQAANTIGAAIDSALRQTRAPHEVIVVDDGSTDDLERALAPFGDSIVVLHKENGGESSAKNLGARVATGTHIDLLDADDAFAPERHVALAEALVVRPDLDLLVTDVHLEVDGRVAATFYGRNAFPFTVADQRREILQRCFVVGPVCVARDRFLEVGGYDERIRIGADWDCWIRMILAGAHVGLIDVPAAYYRMSDTSLSGVRLAQWGARAAVVEKTLADPRLSLAEHKIVRLRLAELRRIELLAHAEVALRARSPEARRASLSVARRPDVARRLRVKALAAAVAPGLAARYLTWRSPQGSRWISRRVS